MVQAALNTRAEPNIELNGHMSRNFVAVKVKQPLVQSIRTFNSSNVGLALSKHLLASPIARPVFLSRDDSFEQLNLKFTGFVERKVLFEFISEFNKTTLQVFFIKVDVELIRMGI
jgi:hypothetical protein